MAAIWIALAAGARRFIPAPMEPRRNPPIWVFLLLAALAAAPFVVEPLRREWTSDGYPLEIQMVCALRNVGLGLAACAGWLLCLRLASVVSLFLILFAAAMTNHSAVMVVLGLYTATGSIWLMLMYWAGLRSVLVAPGKALAIQVQAGSERAPWIGLGILVLLLSGSVALAVIGPKRATYALGELLPTSSGTGEMDPFARYGIGDGPEETAGENARSAGMVETDRMIEDNKNSLIDAVNDLYGPPHKPPKDQERMVAAGKADVIQFHGKLPDNRRPSRDFDTSRKGPNRDRKPSSQGARGLFEVQGRTPLHIRFVVYESYDSASKQWIESRRPGPKLIEPEGDDWMRPGHLKEVAWYRRDERHRFKVADLKSKLVPTPAMTVRFRIHKVNRPDYYEWDYDGVLVLAGRKTTPPGVVVTTDCRTVDPSQLPDSAFGRPILSGGSPPILGEVPAELRPELERLAKAWAGGRQRGWPEIEAVLTQLRTTYTLDRTAEVPPDHPAPVLWFLSESRRGPDYLFATAAALLLRTLDYPTRVCLGYYAAPEAYDAETGHTPVKSSDLHFWPEVRLSDSHWLVVEPTPGYEVLGPGLSLWEHVLSTFMASADWAWRHVGELIILFGLSIVVWHRRRDWIDALSVQLWAWFPGQTWRDQVRRAIGLLERRGRWTGRPRPLRQTAPAWLRSTQAMPSSMNRDLDQLAELAEWASYAPDAKGPWPDAEVLALCHRVVQNWSWKHWRQTPPYPTLGV